MTQPAENLAPPANLQDPPSQYPTRFGFYSLPRAVQDRFLASTSGRGVPEVVLFAPTRRSSGSLGILLALVGTAALLGLVFTGFGDLSSGFAIQSAWVVILYCLAAAAVGLGLMLYAQARARHLRFPFRLGNYLFPVGVIVAQDDQLRLIPISELSGVRGRGGLVRLSFGSQSFDFPLPDGADVGALKVRLEDYRSRFASAAAASNRRELAAMDPIRDNGFSNPLSSKDPWRKPSDPKLLRLATGLVVGILFGALVFAGRNKLASRSLYIAAREADTADAYRNYLARGGERADVGELLLPRAELKQAVGSLAAVERYALEHPDSKIAGEINLALRAELLKELEAVRQRGTLQAIEEFKQAHPRHESIAPELAQARSAVYEQALTKFESSSSAGQETKDVFARLLAFSEQHGPKVEVRFRRHVPKSVERSDSAIRRSAYFAGTASLPSQYLEAKHAEPRERAAAERIISALQPLWSPELVSFQRGPALVGDGELPKVEVPTLLVSYSTEMSGGYTTQRPRGVYVGLGMMMRADFIMPDGESALGFKDSSWLPPDVNEIWRDNLTPGQVYDRNARLGFDRFVEKYLLQKFAVAAPPSPPLP